MGLTLSYYGLYQCERPLPKRRCPRDGKPEHATETIDAERKRRPNDQTAGLLNTHVGRPVILGQTLLYVVPPQVRQMATVKMLRRNQIRMMNLVLEVAAVHWRFCVRHGITAAG